MGFGTEVYGSLAVLKSSKPTLSKTRHEAAAEHIGIMWGSRWVSGCDNWRCFPHLYTLKKRIPSEYTEEQ